MIKFLSNLALPVAKLTQNELKGLPSAFEELLNDICRVYRKNLNIEHCHNVIIYKKI